MWVSFKPVKNRKMVVRIAEKMMKVKPVKIEKADKGWQLSLKVNNKSA